MRLFYLRNVTTTATKSTTKTTKTTTTTFVEVFGTVSESLEKRLW